MAGYARSKLLICVVAFDAQATLAGVLRRIPRALFSDFFCQILVIDDASSDATFAVGANYVRTNVDVPIRMLHNERNQGYGGSQKLGYTYAIEHGFEFVALVHGDGQYAPECLPDLLQPLVRGEADAVLGSRMLTPGAARQGGMPLYKFVGNRILTRIQNALLSTNLSEFHTGYRLYRVAALMQIEFRQNTDDFHFDTEIIIQLLNARARIGERAIPTHYGDEVCHVNGLRYACDVLRVTLLNVAHRAGVRHVQRFAPSRLLNLHTAGHHG